MTARWKYADYVMVEVKSETNLVTRQFLVACDNPSLNEKPWLIVADENDWDQVGTRKKRGYVTAENATLLWRDNRIRVETYGLKPKTEPVTPRAEVLREAEGLITGDRNKTYGEPTDNFDAIASFWNIQFGYGFKESFRFTGAKVAQAMAHVKLARMRAQPKKDNWLDLIGYAACGHECDENENAGA